MEIIGEVAEKWRGGKADTQGTFDEFTYWQNRFRVVTYSQ